MNGSKKKFFLNLAAAIFSVLFLSFFGMDHFVSEIETSSAKIIEDKRSIYILTSKNSQLPDSRKRYKEMENKVGSVLETIVDKDRTADFIKEAEKTAVDSNVILKMQDSRAKVDANDAFISSSDFAFTVGGSFEGVMKFLYSLENFKYEVDVSDLKMEFGSFDEYNKDVIVLSFNLKLYKKETQQ